MGDPIAKARHQPQGKVGQTSLRSDRDLEQTTTRQGDPIAKTRSIHQEGEARAFDPIEDWDRPDPEGCPHREDLKRKTRSRGPEGAPVRNARRRAIGEVGGDPRPTNWRGRTTNITPSAETQQGDQQRHVHGRETSSNAAMARPTGQNQSAPHYGRKQGEDWWPHASPPENDGARSQRGLAKIATSPEELESSRRPDRCRTTREREKTPTKPGWEHPGKDRN